MLHLHSKISRWSYYTAKSESQDCTKAMCFELKHASGSPPQMLGLISRVLDLVDLGWDLRSGNSNKFPDDASAGGPRNYILRTLD